MVAVSIVVVLTVVVVAIVVVLTIVMVSIVAANVDVQPVNEPHVPVPQLVPAQTLQLQSQLYEHNT